MSNILIVEDERIVALDLASSLERLGHHVVAKAFTGEEAIEISQSKAFDLAIVDINLGNGLDGVSTAAYLSDEFSLPIVYISGNTDSDTMERVKITEPVGFIVKPFRESDIDTTLFLGLQGGPSKPVLELQPSSLSLEIVDTLSKSSLQNCLSRLELFSGLCSDNIDLLLEGARLETYKKGAKIQGFAFEASPVVVISGRVALQEEKFAGKRLIYSLIGANEVYVPSESLPKKIELVAQVESKVLHLPQKIFTTIVSSDASLQARIVGMSFTQLRKTLEFTQSLAYSSAPIRIAQSIQQLTAYANRDGRIRTSRSEVAALSGTRNETVTRTLKSMELDGIIELGKRGVIRVCDVNALNDIVDSEE